jgi:uncharacterized protein YkwD
MSKSKRLARRRPFGSRASAAWLAAIAALVLSVALPSPSRAATWDPYSFSSTEEGTLLTLINQYRASNGLPAVKVDSTLHSVAEWRSKDMYDRNYMSHCDPSVTTCGSGTFLFAKKLQSLGYCYNGAGEIIQANNYWDDQTTQKALDWWESSPTHNAVLLGAYTRVGIGIFKGDGRWHNDGPAYGGGSGSVLNESQSLPVHVFTAVFATPCASATPSPTPTPKPTATATPKPTATATPKPTATATPKPAATPTATPKATPRPTASPTSTPAPTATPPPTPAPEATPGPSPEPSPDPSPTVDIQLPTSSFEVFGEPDGDARAWLRFARTHVTAAGGVEAQPAEPGAGPQGLQVVVPLPSLALLDAVVGGVVGTFFGD